MHCNGSEAWQKILFNFFLFFSTLCYQRRDWILTKLVNLHSRFSLSFCIFCTKCSANISKHTECSQNILIFVQNVHGISCYVQNVQECSPVFKKQRHLNLPLLFIINGVDKRVALWYKLSITEWLGNAFLSSESVIELLDCTMYIPLNLKVYQN